MGKRRVIKKDTNKPVDKLSKELEKLLGQSQIQKMRNAQFDKDGNYHGDRYDEKGRFIEGDK